MDELYILGVDPGVTTGLCAVMCTLKGTTVDVESSEAMYLEIVIDDSFSEYILDLLQSTKPDLVVIESVVASGFLNREKIQQIQAYDRVLVAAHSLEIPTQEVLPQAVKQIKDVPKEVKGNHARDAYRAVAAYLRSSARVI